MLEFAWRPTASIESFSPSKYMDELFSIIRIYTPAHGQHMVELTNQMSAISFPGFYVSKGWLCR